MKKQQGFTLIELLVVIAVLLFFLLMAVVSIGNIKERGRDAKRLNDIVNLKQSLAIVFEETGDYLRACGGADYRGAVSKCVGEGDNYILSTYLDNIALLNDPLEKSILCDATCSKTPCNYAFRGVGQASYEVRFWLERATADLARGCHKLTPAGIE